MSPRAASILCYVPWLGWLAAVYVLASAKFQQSRDTRFHAYQGLYLFVAWLVLDWAITPWIHLMSVMRKTPLEGMLQLFLLVVWIVMLIKTSRGERYSLPAGPANSPNVPCRRSAACAVRGRHDGRSYNDVAG